VSKNAGIETKTRGTQLTKQKQKPKLDEHESEPKPEATHKTKISKI
jgi:hypothetical protein